jgi:hypothetical protein
MNNNPRNYSGLFNLFSGSKPTKKTILFQKIGKISFTTSFIAGIIANFFKDQDSVFSRVLLVVFGVGTFLGLFTFIANGIESIGREKGKTNFLSSTMYVLRNTFLFLLLPVAILTAVMIIWAIITEQPAFR